MEFLKTIFSKLTKATRDRFVINERLKSIQLLLDTEHNQYFTLEFDKLEVEILNDSCIDEAYNIEATNESLGTLYIQYLNLDRNCTYTGSIGGHFDDLIRQQISNIKFVDSYQDRFTRFAKYKIDDENEVATIWFNLNDEDVLIFDQKGLLFNNLLDIYGAVTKTLYINNTDKNLDIKIEKNLVDNNIVENYYESDDL